MNLLAFSISGGYGAKLLKLRMDPMSVMDNDSEFPLILGRDVSGVVVDCGSEVTHFVPGDEVGAALHTCLLEDVTVCRVGDMDKVLYNRIYNFVLQYCDIVHHLENPLRSG